MKAPAEPPSGEALLPFLMLLLVLVAVPIALIPQPADAQYFGRNKVQYEQFDFRVLQTPNFEIHFYPEVGEVVEDAARMAERWYERHARIFGHELGSRRPLILYADHPDFQQTNVLDGNIGEATGGVTEGLRDRVIMPLGTSYGDTDHVLGHELVHSFQFDIAGRGRTGLRGLMQLPLWFVEGMAEYLSVGSEDSHTGMWLRDALLHDEFPTTRAMTDDPQRYFPYRFGHAFWAFVGGTWGDAAVNDMLRIAVRSGFDQASVAVLGTPADTLSRLWRESTEAHYAPLMDGRTPPSEAGELLLSPETGAGSRNVAPSLSPDGRYVAFLSERDLFTVEFYLADAETGEIIRTLTSSFRDAHFDAIRFIDSSAGWSPDGQTLAVVVFTEGRNSIQLYRIPDGRRGRRLDVAPEIGEIRGPVFTPDGATIVFSGKSEGTTDLYRMDVASGEVTQLTDDRYSQLQPTVSPDGGTVAFVTDMSQGTDFDQLTFGREVIGLLDLETLEIERLAPLPEAQHWNPQFAPDGGSLYFLADPDGFRDIFRLDLDSGELARVTRVATAVGGITPSTPALSVAMDTGDLAFSVFDGGEYHIMGRSATEAEGEPVVPAEVMLAAGRRLPDASAPGSGRVNALLDSPTIGLPPAGAFRADEAAPYDAGLGLEWIGQGGVGVGADQFGTFVGGSVAAQFSDMLGNRTLAAALQAQGEVEDIGGQLFYQNVRNRWNWGVGLGHVPQRYFRSGSTTDPETGNLLLIRDLERIRQTRAEAMVQFPFSTIRRIEANAGYTRFGFDAERDIFTFDPLGRLIDQERIGLATPDALNLGQVSVALVEDNSFFGFTAPVRGWRSRFEVSQTIGSISYTQALLDHRRYTAPFGQFTLAFRGLHLGRYGLKGDEFGPVRPFYLGWETFIRGYASRTFELQECSAAAGGGCPEFDRLFGQRIGVLSTELRLPFFGVERWGLIDFPYLPTDLVLFADAGVAWDAGDGAEIRFDRQTTDRVPVFSTGAGARINLLGALLIEVYYAYPWQRPEKGGHFGFHFAPGW